MKNMEDLINAMHRLAASASHTGGTDVNIAALARSLGDLGEMAAAIGERVAGVEERLMRLEQATSLTE